MTEPIVPFTDEASDRRHRRLMRKGVTVATFRLVTIAMVAISAPHVVRADELKVFLTASDYSGSQVGGLTGADAKCQAQADAAGLPGTYVAWLSSSTVSAGSRIAHATVPYVQVDGTQVADDWTDLTDGSIDAAITLTATGVDRGVGGVWTATATSGGISDPAHTCSDWTSNSGLGADGYHGASHGDWTVNSVQPLDNCTVANPLYCVQTIVCGNGNLEPGEACDAGIWNGTLNNNCLPGCIAARCGDGLLHTTGQCRDQFSLACDYGCGPQGCFFQGPFELCDDGNTISGDGCSATCLVEEGYVPMTVTISGTVNGSPVNYSATGASNGKKVTLTINPGAAIPGFDPNIATASLALGLVGQAKVSKKVTNPFAGVPYGWEQTLTFGDGNELDVTGQLDGLGTGSTSIQMTMSGTTNVPTLGRMKAVKERLTAVSAEALQGVTTLNWRTPSGARPSATVTTTYSTAGRQPNLGSMDLRLTAKPSPGGSVAQLAMKTVLKDLAVPETTICGGSAFTCTGSPNYCWGSNFAGEHGSGTTCECLAGEWVQEPTEATQIACGGNRACLVRKDGTVVCWGTTLLGDPASGRVPVQKSGLTGVVALALSKGDTFSCALEAGGQILCWGKNEAGQLGRGSIGGSDINPVLVSGISGAIAVSAGSEHACAVMGDHSVRCWGRNFDGQLGNGSTTDSGIPVAVSGLQAMAIAAGYSHTCAVATDGTARCWGKNASGQLGSSGGDALTPRTVTNLSGVSTMAAGDDHTCALTSAGAVYCWGRANNGRLGNGSTATGVVLTPTKVVNLGPARAITAGSQHTCALLKSDVRKCWGRNHRYQLTDAASGASIPGADSGVPVP